MYSKDIYFYFFMISTVNTCVVCACVCGGVGGRGIVCVYYNRTAFSQHAWYLIIRSSISEHDVNYVSVVTNSCHIAGLQPKQEL